MCFTAIIYGKDKVEARDLLLVCMEEYMTRNPHGFALRQFPGKEAFRTMSENKFINHALKCNSQNLHLHFRFSTNVISDEFVHLWRGKNFTFGHNGVISNIPHRNDSLGFMEKIKEDVENLNYYKLSEHLDKFDGYGVFTIMYDNGESVLISANKSVKITKFGESIMFSSDTPSFIANSFEYDLDTTVNFKGFKFVSSEEKKVKISIKSNITNEAENCLLHIGSDGRLINMVDLDIKKVESFHSRGAYSNKVFDGTKNEWVDAYPADSFYNNPV